MQGAKGKHTRAKPRPGPPSQTDHVTLLPERPVSEQGRQGEAGDGEGNGNQLQYSCLGKPMDRGAWRAAVHGIT